MSDFNFPHITEKRYLEISPKSFTTDGTNSGVVTISSTYRFKVGMFVVIKSSTQPSFRVKIQRVISDTQFIVIAEKDAITTKNRLDISMYTVVDTATVEILEEKRPVIDINEIHRQVYEEEPTVALRSHSVDWLGRSYSPTNPLPVETAVPELSLRFDKVSATLMYLAEGIFGALDSEPKWKIKRIEIIDALVVIKNSSETYDQIWDNRASLTYV